MLPCLIDLRPKKEEITKKPGRERNQIESTLKGSNVRKTATAAISANGVRTIQNFSRNLILFSLVGSCMEGFFAT